jgi:hypothetical protein
VSTSGPVSLPFNRIVLVENGRRRELTVEQFLELPLDLRINYVLSRALEFYDAATPVARSVALASLRRISA